MQPYYETDGLALYQGDCREVMASLPECSVDAIVTDPPYGLEFMNVAWDTFSDGPKGAPRQRNEWSDFGSREHARNSSAAARIQANKGRAFYEFSLLWATEALRVLKPGGHVVAFGSPRLYHRMAAGIEDAGFEIRDCLMWLYGSGFPKSLDVSKALDKAAGFDVPVKPSGETGAVYGSGLNVPFGSRNGLHTAVSETGQKGQGWGTALKPAYEPIVLARKPLSGTVAATVLAHGTGGLNIDACRIGDATVGWGAAPTEMYEGGLTSKEDGGRPKHGRWPANVLLDEDAAALLDAQSGPTGAWAPVLGTEPTADGFSGPIYGTQKNRQEATFYGDSGGASRFFYTAKTPRSEREFGLSDLEPTRRSDGREKDIENPRLRTNDRHNDHPTVKPVDLMRWLCRLVTPRGGLICDPFLGSGSTGMAALDEGFRFMGIDLDAHYLDIAQRRISRRHVIETLPQVDDGQGVLL